MSTTINQDVIKAREVVAGYKELNKGTVEEVSYYDPVLKLRRYKKVQIDPNSKDFVKLYGKKKNEKVNKDKPVKFVAKTIDKTKPKKVIKKTVSKPKKLLTPKPKYTKVIQRKPQAYHPDSKTSQSYNLHLEGLTDKEISEKVGISEKEARRYIKLRKIQLGLPVEIKQTIKFEDLERLFWKGLNAIEIAKELNTTENNVFQHLKKVKDNKTPEQQEIEFLEVLNCARKKSQLNSVEHCYSQWVTSRKNKLKYIMSPMVVNQYINELINQGRLILVRDNDKPYLGIKFKFPK